MLRTCIDSFLVTLVDDHNLFLLTVVVVLHNNDTRVVLAIYAAHKLLLVEWLWGHIERQLNLVLFF